MDQEMKLSDLPETWPYEGRESFRKDKLTRREFLAFLEGKVDPELWEASYIHNWRASLNGGRGSMGFSWPAFLFPFNWSCYRKVYPAAFIVLVLVNLISITTANPVSQARLSSVFGLLAILGIRIVYGFMANRLLFNRMLRVVENSRIDANEPENQIGLIAERGGVSNLALGLSLLVNVGAVVLRLLESSGRL